MDTLVSESPAEIILKEEANNDNNKYNAFLYLCNLLYQCVTWCITQKRYFDHPIKYIVGGTSMEAFPLFCFDLERLIRILFPGWVQRSEKVPIQLFCYKEEDSITRPLESMKDPGVCLF